MVERDLGHGGRGRPSDREPVTGTLDGEAVAGQKAGELTRARRDRDHRTATACGHRRDGLRGQQLAGSHDHEVVGEHVQLADEVAGHEDRAAPLCEVPEVGPQPADAVGVKSVGGLVEQQYPRVAQQRRGQCQALAHPERVPACPAVRRRLEPDIAQHFIDAGGPDAGDRCHSAQMVATRAARVHATGVEHRSHDLSRVPEVRVPDPVVADLAAIGAGETDHHAHGRRLSGSVGADEARDATGRHGEGHVVDDDVLAVLLADS